MKNSTLLVIVILTAAIHAQSTIKNVTSRNALPMGCKSTLDSTFGLVPFRIESAGPTPKEQESKSRIHVAREASLCLQPTLPAFSQIQDGQVQAPTDYPKIYDPPCIPIATPIHQIPDGQVQYPGKTLTASSVSKPHPPRLTTVPKHNMRDLKSLHKLYMPKVSDAPVEQLQAPNLPPHIYLHRRYWEKLTKKPEETLEHIKNKTDEVSDAIREKLNHDSDDDSPSSDDEAQTYKPRGANQAAPAVESSTTDFSRNGLVSCRNKQSLNATLANGILRDNLGRTAYIASNYQLQFDSPPQAGAIITSGFSICENGSLALAGNAIWYLCQSGDFSNIYDRYWAKHCRPTTIVRSRFVSCGE